MSQKTKQTIIAIIIIIIAFIGFKMFFVDQSSTGSTLTSEVAGPGQFIDGQAILVLLNRLNQVSLDSSIFSNKVFTSLVNFEKPIEEQAVGRPNPFLPIGIDGSNPTAPKGTSTVRSY